MMYLVLKKTKKSWKVVALVQAHGYSEHERTVRRILEEYKLKSGEFWVIPTSHSSFITVNKGKLKTKEKPFSIRWKNKKKKL